MCPSIHFCPQKFSGGVGAWVILMSTPGPFLLNGEIFFTCVADLGWTSGPDLELDNNKNLNHLYCLLIRSVVSFKSCTL